MSHMVIYRGVDGKPGYHQTDDIHDAVGFVEQMRNEDGVEHARIFRLEEVVFEYRPYYRVELSDSDGPELAGALAEGSIEFGLPTESAVIDDPIDLVESPAPDGAETPTGTAMVDGPPNGPRNGTANGAGAGVASKKGLFGR